MMRPAIVINVHTSLSLLSIKRYITDKTEATKFDIHKISFFV